MNMLVKSVFQLEVRLERWHMKDRRSRLQKGYGNDSSSDDES